MTNHISSLNRIPIQLTDEAKNVPRYHVAAYGGPKKSGYVYDVRMMGHSSISDHPETPQRIARIFAILAENNIIQPMQKLPTSEVRKHQALLVHSEDHWEKVEAVQCENGIRQSYPGPYRLSRHARD